MQQGLIKNFKNFIIDLDGVLYLLNKPIPEGIDFVNFIKKRGNRIAFLSNNTFFTREKYAEKLKKMGIDASPEEVFSSAFVTASCLSAEKAGARVYVVGELGLRSEIERCGLSIVSGNSKNDVDFVVVGMDRRFNFSKMSVALRFLLKGAQLVGTNPDPTYPTDKELLPGCGAIVAAIEACSGQKARIVGKPSLLILDFLLRNKGFAKEETMIIGDRLDTDIVLGKKAGIFSTLVLTGISKSEEVNQAKLQPDLIVNNLLELKEMCLRGDI